MEWDFEIKLKIWRFALLRRKDKFMRTDSKRYIIGYKDELLGWTYL